MKIKIRYMESINLSDLRKCTQIKFKSHNANFSAERKTKRSVWWLLHSGHHMRTDHLEDLIEDEIRLCKMDNETYRLEGNIDAEKLSGYKTNRVLPTKTKFVCPEKMF